MKRLLVLSVLSWYQVPGYGLTKRYHLVMFPLKVYVVCFSSYSIVDMFLSVSDCQNSNDNGGVFVAGYRFTRYSTFAISPLCEWSRKPALTF